MIHKFSIDSKSGVTYRNRKLAEELGLCLARDGGSRGITFGTEPCQGVLGKLFSAFNDLRGASEGGPAPNIGVDIKMVASPTGSGSRLISTSDQTNVLEFDAEDLQPVGQKFFNYADLNPAFRGQFSSTHGQRDVRTGEYFNYALFVQGPRKYVCFSIPDGEPAGHVLAEFTAPPAYLHSFGLTEHYFVLLVWPSTFTTMPPKILYKRNVLDTINWQPELGVKIYVVDRQKRELVAQYQCKPFYCFHTVNSFEEDEQKLDGSVERHVHVDLVGYEDESIIRMLKVTNLRSDTCCLPRSRYCRVSCHNVNAAAGAKQTNTASYQTIFEGVYSMELPRINESLHMKPHRFVYCVANHTHLAGGEPGHPSVLSDCLLKIDLGAPGGAGSTQHQIWSAPDCFPGEPVFLPRPGAISEDDGVVLSVVTAGKGASFMLVLDAQRWVELARATTPNTFPAGFHGIFRNRDATNV